MQYTRLCEGVSCSVSLIAGISVTSFGIPPCEVFSLLPHLFIYFAIFHVSMNSWVFIFWIYNPSIIDIFINKLFQH